MTERHVVEHPTHDELAGLSLLRGVEPSGVLTLLVRSPVHRLADHEVLLSRDQENDTLYVVLEGRLGVFLDALEGEPSIVLETGQTVGELSVIDGSPASATVVAMGAVRLLEIEQDAFWRAVQLSHEFAINLLFLFATRLRRGNQTIVEGTRERLAIERSALVDVLTGLSNRRWLEDRLPRFLSRHEHSGDPLSILVIDIDHFKRINDDFGHAAGDDALRAVGKTITACLRPTDFAARYGGEEMVVILPDTALEGAMAAAERLRRVIAAATPLVHEGRALPVITVSIGVTQATDGDTATTIVSRADTGLYRAKAEGRNRVCPVPISSE